MRVGRPLGITILCSLSFFTLMSQQQEDDTYGSWFVVSGQHKVHEQWNIPTVAILRLHEMFDNYEFVFFRTGIHRNLSPNTNLGVGMAYLDSQKYTEDHQTQNQTQLWLYEQFSIKIPLYRSAITQRYRLESRWIQQNSETVFNIRARLRAQYTFSLSQRVYIKLFDEIFINLNDSFFNQNRLYAGIGYKATKNLKVDIGYLKNHFASRQNNVVRMGISFTTHLFDKNIDIIENLSSKNSKTLSINSLN